MIRLALALALLASPALAQQPPPQTVTVPLDLFNRMARQVMTEPRTAEALELINGINAAARADAEARAKAAPPPPAEAAKP